MAQVPIAFDQVDDGLLVDAQLDWGGGVNNTAHPTNLAADEFADGENASIRNVGKITQRPGSVEFGDELASTAQAMSYFILPDGTLPMLCAIVAGELWVCATAGGTWSKISGMTSANTTTRFELRYYIGRLYIFSGISTEHVFYFDGSALTDCGDPAVSPNPPNFLISCVQQFRLFLADGDEVWASDVLTHDFPTATNINRITSGNADTITAMAPLGEDKVCIGKDRSIHALKVTGDISTWTSWPITETVGCLNAQSMVGSSTQVLWVTKGAVYGVQDAQNSWTKISEVVLSAKIQDYMDHIDWSVNTVCTYFDDYFLLSCQRDTGEHDLLVLDWKRKGWCPRWTVWEPLHFAQGVINGQYRCFFIKRDGVQVYEAFSGQKDVDDYIDFYVITRGFTHEAAALDKTCRSIQNLFLGTFGDTSIQLIDDHEQLYTVDSFSLAAPLLWGAITWTFTWGANTLYKRIRPVLRRRSLWWQMKISHEGGPIILKGSYLSAFAETYNME